MLLVALDCENEALYTRYFADHERAFCRQSLTFKNRMRETEIDKTPQDLL